MNTSGRIDTHFHIVPDFYAQAVEETGGDPTGWKTPGWSVEQAKAHMKELGIQSAVMSVTAPAVNIYANDVAKARDLARKCNDFSAKLAKEDPTRFGWFATIPPPTDTEGCLEEIDRAFNELGADGVTLLTSYFKDNKSLYLGNELFSPIWDKLESLNAIVFIHPTGSVVPAVSSCAPQPLFDFPQETTRTAADLVISGTKGKYPNIKMILSHAGGTIPFLAPRISGIQTGSRTPQQMREDFRSFYFDTALSTSKGQLLALLELADPSHIFFGSDVPYAPFEVVKFVTKQLDEFLSTDEHKYLAQKVNRENALALFPKFSQSSL
jgi:predicted TIM-barrel fold metal-dependent hydrolase